MKSVVIHVVHIVGFKRYNGKPLPINTQLRLEHEPDNPVDKCAIVVKDVEGKRLAYIERTEAPVIFKLITMARTFVCRPQRRAYWLNSVQGQAQECRIGFRINDNDIDQVKEILRKFKFTII